MAHLLTLIIFTKKADEVNRIKTSLLVSFSKLKEEEKYHSLICFCDCFKFSKEDNNKLNSNNPNIEH